MNVGEQPYRILGVNGIDLVGLRWDVVEPRGVVAIAHGIHEHIGRYRHVALALNAAGYSVAGVDHQGHGRSAAPQQRTSNIRRFDDYVDDYIAVIETLFAVHTVPVIALGHSMGGLIAARAAMRIQDRLGGLVLSGPALQIPTDLSPLRLKLSLAISRLVPFIKAPGKGIDGLSRDPMVRQRLIEDELGVKQPLKLGIARQLLLLSTDTLNRAAELTLPMLVMHGAADTITLPAGSEEFVRNASSPDKDFVRWPGDLHEIFNELDQDAVIAKLVDWLNIRFPANTRSADPLATASD